MLDLAWRERHGSFTHLTTPICFSIPLPLQSIYFNVPLNEICKLLLLSFSKIDDAPKNKENFKSFSSSN